MKKKIEIPANISGEELKLLIKKLRNDYGITADFQMVDHKKPHFRYNPRDHRVYGGYNKEITLHEFGHSQDPLLRHPGYLALNGILDRAVPITAIAGLATPTVSQLTSSENRENQELVGAAIAGTGGLAGLAHWHMKGKAEDRANEFVKRVLQDELGGKGLAEQAFEESPLPWGRDTYRKSLGKKILRPILAGGATTLLASGLSPRPSQGEGLAKSAGSKETLSWIACLAGNSRKE